jgi:hypothetical protein
MSIKNAKLPLKIRNKMPIPTFSISMPAKLTQFGIFCFKIYHLATLNLMFNECM